MSSESYKCNHCEREFKTEEGSVIHEENCKKRKSSRKVGMISIGVFILLILGYVIFANDPSPTGYSTYEPSNDYKEENKNVIESCPYECCLSGEFFAKQCSQNYQCMNNKCIAIDSDNDGLTDIEEINIGTNPQLYDTDGDTLSDYQEYKILGTNPLKKNTDRDRYDDNEDPSPLEKNTANIRIEGTSSSELNYFNVGLIFLTGGLSALDPSLELYSTNINLEIINDGNDYTSYGSYDIVILIGNDVMDIETFSFSRINAGSSISQSTIFSTTIGDIPSQLISLITQDENPSVEIRNLDYERF